MLSRLSQIRPVLEAGLQGDPPALDLPGLVCRPPEKGDPLILPPNCRWKDAVAPRRCCAAALPGPKGTAAPGTAGSVGQKALVSVAVAPAGPCPELENYPGKLPCESS